MRGLKYGRDTTVTSRLADALAPIAPRGDIVTWVPSTRGHRRSRGFDPSELLARAVARRLGLRARRLLRRHDTEPQTGRDRGGRMVGPDIVAVTPMFTKTMPACVLVIDDVCTTGSTLAVAAEALRARGVRSVVAAVVTVSGPGSREPAPRASHGRDTSTM